MSNVQDRLVVRGEVTVELFSSDGQLKHREVTHNLVTNAGDAAIAAALLAASALALDGMSLGVSATAATKADATLNDDVGNSYKNQDSTYPKVISDGSHNRVVSNKVTWDAGEATDWGISEVGLWTDGTPGGAPSGTLLAHAVLSSAVNKEAGDTLAITWNITITGA